MYKNLTNLSLKKQSVIIFFTFSWVFFLNQFSNIKNQSYFELIEKTCVKVSDESCDIIHESPRHMSESNTKYQCTWVRNWCAYLYEGFKWVECWPACDASVLVQELKFYEKKTWVNWIWLYKIWSTELDWIMNIKPTTIKWTLPYTKQRE